MIKPRFQGKHRVESTRLPNRNYAANGWYFITICTKYCFHYFGQVVLSQVKLSEIGEIAQKCWVEIPNHFEHTHSAESKIASKLYPNWLIPTTNRNYDFQHRPI